MLAEGFWDSFLLYCLNVLFYPDGFINSVKYHLALLLEIGIKVVNCYLAWPYLSTLTTYKYVLMKRNQLSCVVPQEQSSGE